MKTIRMKESVRTKGGRRAEKRGRALKGKTNLPGLG
jgi:hypothetical protein